MPAGLSDTFQFSHNETPNTPPCPPGSASVCDDVVTIGSVNLNQLITVGSDTYFFNLLGFSTDGGTTIQFQYLSPEGGTNRAGLFGVVTSQPIPSVPEPATLTLLGSGLMVAGFARRRLRSRR